MTHHAYIIEAGRNASIRDKAIDIIFGNRKPEVVEFSFDTMSVGESRIISEIGSQKAGSMLRAVFIYANFITREAQNALLKTLEEPSAGTTFFVVTPSSAELSPTVISRLSRLLVTPTETSVISDPMKFLSADIVTRMKMTGEFVVAIADEEKSRIEAIRFVESLEKELHRMANTNMRCFSTAAELERIRSYLYDRAPSVKMLLEYVALAIPRF